MKNLITFDNVGVRYGSGSEILKDIKFELNSGEFMFLTGHSGSGKTTFLNMINGSIKPSRGYLSVFDHDLSSINHKDLSLIRRKIGIIFQDFKLLNHLTVYENIALPLKILKLHAEEINSRVIEMLNWIELYKMKNVYPCTLSGGEQQRVAIARAVINNPDLILADEPTGSIDSAMANKILSMIEHLNKKGVAVVFATHNMDFLQNTTYPVAFVQNHRIQVYRKSNSES